MLKYVWSGRPVSFILTIVIVLPVFFVLGHYSKTEFKSCQIEFELETEQSVNFAVYYDVGRRFNQVDHQSVMIDTVNEPVKVNFCIPILNELYSVRFDPAQEHARMKIHSVTLFYDGGDTFAVPLDTIEPQNDIKEHHFDGKSLVFETAPEGEDPIFLLTRIRTSDLKSQMQSPLRYLLWGIAGLVSVLLGGFTYTFFFMAEH